MAPFGNDRALDLLDDLAELNDAEKATRLTEVLEEGIASRADDAPLGHEVVAAAALIALALPGGVVSISQYADGEAVLRGNFDPDDDQNAEEEWTLALLLSPRSELIRLAIMAVENVTQEDSQWRQVWVSEADRDEAIQRIRHVVDVLRANLPADTM